jgi:hypothetical protein
MWLMEFEKPEGERVWVNPLHVAMVVERQDSDGLTDLFLANALRPRPTR